MYESIRIPSWSWSADQDSQAPPTEALYANMPPPPLAMPSLREQYARLRRLPAPISQRPRRRPAGLPVPAPRPPRDRPVGETLLLLAQDFRRQLLTRVSDTLHLPAHQIDPFQGPHRQAVEDALQAMREAYGDIPLNCLRSKGRPLPGHAWRIDDATVALTLLAALREQGETVAAISKPLVQGTDGHGQWQLHHVDHQLFFVARPLPMGWADADRRGCSMGACQLEALAASSPEASVLAAATDAFLSSATTEELMAIPASRITTAATASRLLRRLGPEQAKAWAARHLSLEDASLSALLAGATHEDHHELLGQLHQRLAGRPPEALLELSGGEARLEATWRHPSPDISKAWMALLLDKLPLAPLMRIFRGHALGQAMMPAAITLRSPALIEASHRRIMEVIEHEQRPREEWPGLLAASPTIGHTNTLLSLSREGACAQAWVDGLAQARQRGLLDDDQVGELLGGGSALEDCMRRGRTQPDDLPDYVDLLYRSRDAGLLDDTTLEQLLIGTDAQTPHRSALARVCADPQGGPAANAYLKVLTRLASEHRLTPAQVNRLVQPAADVADGSPLFTAWTHRHLGIINVLLGTTLTLAARGQFEASDWRALIATAGPGGRGLWHYRSQEPLSRRARVLFDLLDKAETVGALDPSSVRQLHQQFLHGSDSDRVYENGPG